MVDYDLQTPATGRMLCNPHLAFPEVGLPPKYSLGTSFEKPRFETGFQMRFDYLGADHDKLRGNELSLKCRTRSG